MRRLLFLLFLIVPLIEIAVFILLGQSIGVLPTLLGVVVTAILGAVLVRTQGMSLLASIRRALGRGELPGRAIGEAMLVGIAGVLMMTPGYFTDLMGLLLLIPPVRALIYAELARRLTVVPVGAWTERRVSGVVDLDDESWRRR